MSNRPIFLKRKIIICLFLVINLTLFFRFSSHAQSSDTDIIPVDGKLTKLFGGFGFTEGPACDKFGNIYFTDQPNDRIYCYNLRGELELWAEGMGRANGLLFDKEGNLLSCSDLNNQLWSIAPDKKVKILIQTYKNNLLNGPNDVWESPNGGIYITDPFYKRPWWKRETSQQDGQHVYYLPPHSTHLTRVISDIQAPNGIVGSKDGKILYVSDINANKIYRYTIACGGSLNNKTMFIERKSDGITLDDRGNLYLTGNGVLIVNPQGRIIAEIKVPERWTSNVCFGGKNRDLLLITASEAVYGIKLNVKGIE